MKLIILKLHFFQCKHGMKRTQQSNTWCSHWNRLNTEYILLTCLTAHFQLKKNNKNDAQYFLANFIVTEGKMMNEAAILLPYFVNNFF